MEKHHHPVWYIQAMIFDNEWYFDMDNVQGYLGHYAHQSRFIIVAHP